MHTEKYQDEWTSFSVVELLKPGHCRLKFVQPTSQLSINDGLRRQTFSHCKKNGDGLLDFSGPFSAWTTTGY